MTPTLETIGTGSRANAGLLLHGVDWATYTRLHDLLDAHGVRMTFLRGSLEIHMAPLYEHESGKQTIHRLVAALSIFLGIPIESAGSFTMRKPQEAGLEPDDCFYIASAAAVLGQQSVDPAVHPPDLVVEVDATRSSVDKLAAYALLRVPEVWRYDANGLTIHRLGDTGYALADVSSVLPMLSAVAINAILAIGKRRGQTAMVSALRNWLAEHDGRISPDTPPPTDSAPSA